MLNLLLHRSSISWVSDAGEGGVLVVRGCVASLLAVWWGFVLLMDRGIVCLQRPKPVWLIPSCFLVMLICLSGTCTVGDRGMWHCLQLCCSDLMAL